MLAVLKRQQRTTVVRLAEMVAELAILSAAFEACMVILADIRAWAADSSRSGRREQRRRRTAVP